MRARFVMLAAALLPLVLPGHALSADPTTPVGLWQTVDSTTKQPTGWFLIANHDGVYDGIIAKMFLEPGQDPNVVCDQCKDDRHDHPWLGLEIIRGMVQEAEDKYGGGTILDPRDGKVYHATMKVTPDGQTLIVRGYIGVELLGQNQYWTRLPDTAYSMLDPSVNPNPAANPNAPANAKHPPAPHKSELVPLRQ
jgi:uncharacterized protein (DUF2147 family)